ncbi:MAG TPA: hypothetical protein DD638_08170 [Pasteurellaceae bacterium]|nr:hypothetical protein [Pasteurellaceae bacterium]
MKLRKDYLLFAFFDITYLSVYFIRQLNASKIPFYSDLIQLVRAAENYGEMIPENSIFVYVMSLPSYILYFSLFFSVWYYLKQNRKIRCLVFCQTPLRIVSLMPTIPFLLDMYKMFVPDWTLEYLSDNWSWVIIYIAIILVLEIGKSIYIAKHIK